MNVSDFQTQIIVSQIQIPLHACRDGGCFYIRDVDAALHTVPMDGSLVFWNGQRVSPLELFALAIRSVRSTEHIGSTGRILAGLQVGFDGECGTVAFEQEKAGKQQAEPQPKKRKARS